MYDDASQPGATEARIAKALAHPLRARILECLGERVASPGEIASELGASLGVVSYHVRMLREYGCVELVRTEPVRGALQHFYRALARPELDAQQRLALPAALRGELAGATLQTLVDGLASAAAAGTLADAETVVSHVHLALDERARRKLAKLLARTVEQAQKIAAESAERGAGQPTELALLHYRRASS